MVKLSSDGAQAPSMFERSWIAGLYASMDEVHEVLQENLGDVHEAGWYPHAIVELAPVGFMNEPTEYGRVWYRWDPEWESFRPCEESAGLECVVNLAGIG